MNNSNFNMGKRALPRRLRLVFGVVLFAILFVQYQLSAGSDSPVVLRESVAMSAESLDADPFESLIRRNPLAALIEARHQHLREVTDYECVLVKQELLPSGMSEEQVIKVKFRHAPYSVYMEWLRNPGMAARVLYVQGRWTDTDAEDPAERELAIAQPGAIARIFVKSVKQPIRGRLARKSSRRFVDEFGFQKTLDRLIQFSEIAKARNELTLEFKGDSRFDGRPVWVIRRELPYTEEGGRYPDRTAEVLIDKALRVPVAIYCYSDEDKQPQSLLAKYEYRSVRMGVGLTEKDFDPRTYGM